MSWLTIARKDLVLVSRDRPALLFLVLVPVAVVTIVAGTLGGAGGGTIRMPVVNEDEGPVAEVLIESLSKYIELTEVSREKAEAMVGRDNEAAAALILPEKLSKRYLAERPSELTLLTDPARGIEVNAVKAYILIADRDTAGIADPLFEELILLEERNLTGNRLTVTDYEQNVPGFSVMFVLMGVLFGVAFGLKDEEEWGALTRLRIAPISRHSFLAGKLLARFVVGVTQMWILFGFGHLVFDISLGPSIATFALLSIAVVFCMTTFSLVVACFARSREQIIPLGLTVTMLVAALGGCWWPIFMSPVWLQHVGHMVPTGWAMDGINDLILRERVLAEVAPIIGVLLAYGAGCLVIGTWLQGRARSAAT